MMWFIELHISDNGSPIFVNFDKVSEIHPNQKGGTTIVFDYQNRADVKEDYEMINSFMIRRMSETNAHTDKPRTAPAN